MTSGKQNLNWNKGFKSVEDPLLIDTRQRQQGLSVRNSYHEVCRGVISEGESFDYSGYGYRTAFKVTGGDILLHTLGFFGPVSEDTVKYVVNIEVETATFALPRPSYFSCFGKPTPGRIFGTAREKITAEKNKMFYVSFTPILIQPEDGWVQIKFSLELDNDEKNKYERKNCKTKTNLMGRMKQGEQIDEVSIELPFGFRHFNFSTGSCQMPILRFSIP